MLSDKFVLLKRFLYIFAILTLSLNSFGIDDKNSTKEISKTVLIKVSDSSGMEIPGAKVIITESGKEFIADFNGTIQLQLKSTESLTIKIQSLGYDVKTVTSNELTTFNEFTLNSL